MQQENKKENRQTTELIFQTSKEAKKNIKNPKKKSKKKQQQPNTNNKNNEQKHTHTKTKINRNRK